jgi:putative DNA primase/helicase
MNAESIAAGLQGARRSGDGWMARCPAHDDRKPSLSLRDSGEGKPLVYCHAGCSQGDVVECLKARGLWPGAGQPTKNFNHRGHRSAADRLEQVRDIWNRTRPAKGTIVEAYLRRRGITILPDCLRFSILKHTPSGRTLPTMVAAVRDLDSNLTAIHRTFLKPDGSGKADVEPAKMSLGQCAGASVHLATAGLALAVGEGIETCLSVLESCPELPVWSALSTSGLRSIELPAEIRDVTIVADGDHPGEIAARWAAGRFLAERRNVRIARPPRGADFNDVLVG